ncbi:phospholipase/carboxylesterase [Microdochium nivale]|nr:phospholipase/carboxylesterase [Microdochium nivale]
MPPPPPKRHAATRIPQASDFEHLKPSASSPSGQARGLHVSLVYPHDVPETTTSIMVLLHGFGDSDVAFAQLARSLNLPGVLGIAVRGVEPLPPALLGLDPAGSQEEEVGGGGGGGGVKHWHWGDDVSIDPATGGMDLDPGFGKAQKLVLDGLVLDTLVGRLGWRTEDILLFGFGQGGSLALGMASRLRDGGEGEGRRCHGV